jgi:hypothetical protein
VDRAPSLLKIVEVCAVCSYRPRGTTASDLLDRDVVGRHRHRRPRRGPRPHRAGRDRGGALHEGPAPLETVEQPLGPAQPRPASRDGQVADRVAPVVMQRMGVDDTERGQGWTSRGSSTSATSSSPSVTWASVRMNSGRASSSSLHPWTGVGWERVRPRSLGWFRHLEHRGCTRLNQAPATGCHPLPRARPHIPRNRHAQCEMALHPPRRACRSHQPPDPGLSPLALPTPRTSCATQSMLQLLESPHVVTSAMDHAMAVRAKRNQVL